jgi:hypothetical protein
MSQVAKMVAQPGSWPNTFTGLLTLSRLSLLSNAISALYTRSQNNYRAQTRADVAYALIGLLHYRLEKDTNDSLFQAFARLSLKNDSDNIMERMLCLLPDPNDSGSNLFDKLARPDVYSTHVRDIKPLCQIVGIAEEDNTILADNCRSIHIRWKDFPSQSKTSARQGRLPTASCRPPGDFFLPGWSSTSNYLCSLPCLQNRFDRK